MTIQEEKSYKELELLEERYPVLKAVHAEIEKAYLLRRDSFVKGGKLLLCGNGGSSADCDHIVGELMKAFCAKRKIKPELSSRLQELYGEEAEYFTKHLEQGLPAVLVGTKADKLKRSQLEKQKKLLRETLGATKETPLILFSSVTKQGREDLLRLVAEMAGEDSVSPQ